MNIIKSAVLLSREREANTTAVTGKGNLIMDLGLRHTPTTEKIKEDGMWPITKIISNHFPKI